MKEKWLSKIKSVKFWLSLTGAVVIVLQLFGLKISAPYINGDMFGVRGAGYNGARRGRGNKQRRPSGGR